MARRSSKKSSSVKVNFKGVESRQTPPEGDYKLEVLEANSKASGNGGDMIEFILEVAEGKYKGTKLWFYCPLSDNSLWKLHAFLTALGEEVPEDEMDIDLSDLVGKEVVGVLTHETYQGKKRAKMTDFASLEDYEGELAGADDDDDDEDEDDKKSSKKSKSKKGSSKKSKSDDDDDDEDEKPAKSKKKASKKDADDEDDDEDEKPAKGKKSKAKSKSDDDDEDEDEKPKRGAKGKASKKKAKKIDKSDVEDMDEDELQELIDEHDLDVDLDDFKKLPKKVAAVIDALEEEDLLEDDD